MATGSSQAATLTTLFTAAFFDGPLAGQAFTGAVATDELFLDSTGSGVVSPGISFFVEDINFPVPGALAGLNDFSLTVDEEHFTAEDDIVFPVFPRVTFADFTLTALDFVGTNANGASLQILSTDAAFTDPLGRVSIGTIATSVPEPTTGLGLAVALALGRFAGRRRSP
ncbi:MAG: PEP-CTERM sorting domain-containing protein [Cyanophyceae cyanobacterium]